MLPLIFSLNINLTLTCSEGGQFDYPVWIYL
jgi:hypothetical protein